MADQGQILSRALKFHRRGRLGDAGRLYAKVLKGNPSDPDALHLLGVVKHQLGKSTEGLLLIEAAMKARPSWPAALSNHATVLQSLNRNEEALRSCDQALAIAPNFVDALHNRGNALRALNRHEAALASYGVALVLNPNHAEVLNDQGLALHALNRVDEALASYEKALAIRPEYAEALYNRGNALHALNRSEEARASYAQALAIKPDFTQAKFAACMAELPILYADEAEISRQRHAYEQKLRALHTEAENSALDLVGDVGLQLPFLLPYQGQNDRELQRLYGSLVCGLAARKYATAPLYRPTSQEPLRVGVVTGYFRQHSVWKIPIKGWISQLDRKQFRIFGYHTGSRTDAETGTAAGLCERFVQGPLAIENWRQEILADKPHVLIYPEVGMDPVSAHLASQRLAAVQCTSFGHPVTSGFPTIDYYLSSALMEPPDADLHYSEQLIRLPNLAIYVEPQASTLTISRQQFGIPESAVAFWCGQTLYKYLPQFDDVYPRIAKEVGDCIFLFIQFHKASQITEVFRRRLVKAFRRLGLSADNHCFFLPQLDQREFVAAINMADVVLDSIGWSGCNSTLESLLYDKPIVTFPGSLMRGRHTMAILEKMGVTETIVDSLGAYVSAAIRLAKDVQWRSRLQSDIGQRKHRLYKDRACISALETFLLRAVHSARL